MAETEVTPKENTKPRSKAKVKQVDLKETLCNRFGQLFNDEITSDVTLVVGNHSFHVHKTILASSSEYFHRMFYGGDWAESSQKEVTLHDTPVCQEVFESFLRCLYAGSIELIPDSAYNVFILVDKYAPKLKLEFLKVLTNVVEKGSVEDVVTWFPTWVFLADEDMVQKCCKVIGYNFTKASESERWCSLSYEHLITILKSTNFVVPNEFTMYDAVQSWILSQKKCSHDVIKQLLSDVRFKSMEPEELAKVAKSSLAKDVAPEILRQILNETCVYQIIGKINEPEIVEPQRSMHYYTDRLGYYGQTLQVPVYYTDSYGDELEVPLEFEPINLHLKPKYPVVDSVVSGDHLFSKITNVYKWNLTITFEEGTWKFGLTKYNNEYTANGYKFGATVTLLMLFKDSNSIVRQVLEVETKTLFNANNDYNHQHIISQPDPNKSIATFSMNSPCSYNCKFSEYCLSYYLFISPY